MTTLSGDLDRDDESSGDKTDNAYHVVTGSDTDATAILDGFTITAGNASGASSPVGGGMYIYLGAPMVDNCIFRRNSALHGGGMYILGNSNQPAREFERFHSGSRSQPQGLRSYPRRKRSEPRAPAWWPKLP